MKSSAYISKIPVKAVHNYDSSMYFKIVEMKFHQFSDLDGVFYIFKVVKLIPAD